MNSHLSVKVDGADMTLRPDQTIDFELSNPVFNNVEMFSLPFNPPIAENRHLMHNLDDPKSDIRPVSLEGKPAIVYGEGLPLHSGVVTIQDDEELIDGMSMNIDASTRSFDDLIGDLECRDVPLKDKIQIGEKIGNVSVSASYDYQVKVRYEGKKDDSDYHYDNDSVSGTFEPQALGFSWPGVCQVTGSKQKAVQKTSKDYGNGITVKVPMEANGNSESTFINVTDAYGDNSARWGEGGAKYCNARICYLHRGLNDDGTTSSDVVPLKESREQYEDRYPYWVLDADRPQSGICFYVIYFLDCLFAHLGVMFDKSALMAVEDLKHLCFFTTRCCYDSEPITDSSHSFYNMADANAWLESRGCGGQFSIDDPEPKQVQEFKYRLNGSSEVKTVKVGQDEVQSITVTAALTRTTFSANVCKMWANSDNFPEESVKTILDSLEASFGIRFNYDYEQNKVTAYLLRDVFRQQRYDIARQQYQPIEIQQFQGNVHRVHKLSEKITGFRQKYSAESTAKEQRQFIRRGKRDYDTDFDYIEYPADRTVLDKTYPQIAAEASATNGKVYIDLTTGNAYRYKVNGDTMADARLFEVGQFKGIEVGDCSDKAEKDGTVKEYVSDFQPISFNDVNVRNVLGLIKERTGYDNQGNSATIKDVKSGQPMLVAFIDEDMEHEFVEQKINNVLSNDLVDLFLTENLKLIESYDPSGTDDGNSPLQSYDWGLAVAMMRGGGTNMTVQNYDQGYDGFGNYKWRTVSGEYALTSDTMDQIGDEFDYNGIYSGIGEGERFSLKICAYKPFRYRYVGQQLVISTDPTEWGDASWLIPCNEDVTDTQTHEVQKKIRTRGLFNTFMAETCFFYLHRKKLRLKVDTTVAQLADIPNHWSSLWRIGDLLGFIDVVRYKLATAAPLGEVTIDFYAI